MLLKMRHMCHYRALRNAEEVQSRFRKPLYPGRGTYTTSESPLLLAVLHSVHNFKKSSQTDSNHSSRKTSQYVDLSCQQSSASMYFVRSRLHGSTLIVLFEREPNCGSCIWEISRLTRPSFLREYVNLSDLFCHLHQAKGL